MSQNADPVVQALQSVPPGDRAGLQAFARQMVADSQQAPRAVARLAVAGDGPDADKAMEVIGLAPDETFVALLHSAPKADAQRRLWRLQALVETELDLRARLAREARALLDDRSPEPQPPSAGPPPEGLPPPPRVCDRAYLLLRELLKQDDSRTAQAATARVFLHLPLADKDAVIAEFRKSGAWVDVFDR